MCFEPLLEHRHHREILIADALAEDGFQVLPVFLGPAFVLAAVAADEVQLRAQPLALESFPFARVELRAVDEGTPVDAENESTTDLEPGEQSARLRAEQCLPFGIVRGLNLRCCRRLQYRIRGDAGFFPRQERCDWNPDAPDCGQR